MESINGSSPSVVLIGAGRVGTAVALLLKQSGATMAGVSSRSVDSSERARVLLGATTFDYGSELPDAEVILIGTGEDALEEVATTVAPRVSRGAHVVHFAGSLGMAPLESVRRSGGHPCALHPVQACPDVDSAVRRLPGSAWGVTCDDDDFEWAGDFVARTGGRPVRVAEGDRPVWHAASVSVSNGIAALLASGEAMLGSLGISAPESVLGPLAAGTVANALEGGGGGATLTGPVVRNELAAIRRHIAALRDRDAHLADDYALIATTIVRAAARAGRLDEVSAARMLKELESA